MHTTLISSAKIQKRVKILGKKISAYYKNKPFVMVGVLTGAFVFMADLIRAVDGSFECDFIKVSSYQNKKSSGKVKLLSDISTNIHGKNILVVDDILDSGLTLLWLVKHLQKMNPSEIRICCLLDKGKKPIIQPYVKYIGFKIPDKFVVGYGLDFNGKYRALPHIACLGEG